MELNITKKECEQIASILSRRANEIVGFSDDYRRKDEHYGSVELALTREIERLRNLAYKINPPDPDDSTDD